MCDTVRIDSDRYDLSAGGRSAFIYPAGVCRHDAHGINGEAFAHGRIAGFVAGEHIGRIFDGPGCDQRPEMLAFHLPADPGGRHEKDIRAAFPLTAGDFGEAELIADEDADPAKGRIDRVEEAVPRYKKIGFPAFKSVIDWFTAIVSGFS